MEVLTCSLCLHPCHCKGVGPYINTNQCIGYNCNCMNCIHTSTEEETMAKKLVKWIWKIICWPGRKVADWLWTK